MGGPSLCGPEIRHGMGTGVHECGTHLQNGDGLWGVAPRLYRVGREPCKGNFTLSLRPSLPPSLRPLMVIVQKVTLAAWALHDGRARKFSELNADQKLQRIEVQPSPLEYLSYNFNFHTFLAGPSCTIQEYLCFMDGSNVRSKLPDNPNAFANVNHL